MPTPFVFLKTQKHKNTKLRVSERNEACFNYRA